MARMSGRSGVGGARLSVACRCDLCPGSSLPGQGQGQGQGQRQVERVLEIRLPGFASVYHHSVLGERRWNNHHI